MSQLSAQDEKWFHGQNHIELAKAMELPIMQRAMTKMMLEGMPSQALGGVDDEAVQGAFYKGYCHFFRRLSSLTVMPQTAEPRKPAHIYKPEVDRDLTTGETE